jgi:signal transduction histidine kinase
MWIAIEGALAPMRNAFAKKEIELRVETQEALPPVKADRQQLHVILTQMLDNARRYTQAGSVTVRATQQGGMVRVDITDTGPGISPDEFQQLFTRFHRVEGNNSPERGGGLGLAIVRQLVERQGGNVWAESVPDHGSIFSFTLPIAHEHADSVTQQHNGERSA